MEKTSKSAKMDVSMEGGDNEKEDGSDSGEEYYGDVAEDKKKKEVDDKALKDENHAGVKTKAPKQKNQQKPKPVEKKLTSKQRRRMERASKDKKIGFHFYNEVDVKMKRTKVEKKPVKKT